MVFLAIKKIRSTAKIRRFFFGTWSNNSVKRLNLGTWPNSLFSISIKWKVSKNSVNWSPQFRSSEKCQFRSSEIRSSDRLPLWAFKANISFCKSRSWSWIWSMDGKQVFVVSLPACPLSVVVRFVFCQLISLRVIWDQNKLFALFYLNW